MYLHVFYFLQTFGDRTVETRGEIGLLSRNIKIRGNRNDQFDFDIEACPRKFDSGQFSVQSCFNGKFGEETGSDEFGGKANYGMIESLHWSLS